MHSKKHLDRNKRIIAAANRVAAVCETLNRASVPILRVTSDQHGPVIRVRWAHVLERYRPRQVGAAGGRVRFEAGYQGCRIVWFRLADQL
jgi:hypothetical protein